MKDLWNTLHRQGRQLKRGWIAITALFLGLQLVISAPAIAATFVSDVPNISGDASTWIADEADLLSTIAKRTVNKTLAGVAKETGNEIRMVTVRGLNYGVTPQDFADQLFAEWFPIESTQGNQTVLVFDAKTKDAAIHVGQQSQAAISTEFADSLSSESIGILVREGQYNQAFQDTATRIAAVVTGQADPGPPVVEIAQLPERNYKTSEETDDFNATIIVVVLLVVATIVPMVTYYMYLN